MINIKKIMIFLVCCNGFLNAMNRILEGRGHYAPSPSDYIPAWQNDPSVISFYEQSREILNKAKEDAFNEMKKAKEREIEKGKDQKDHEKIKSKL